MDELIIINSKREIQKMKIKREMIESKGTPEETSATESKRKKGIQGINDRAKCY